MVSLQVVEELIDTLSPEDRQVLLQRLLARHGAGAEQGPSAHLTKPASAQRRVPSPRAEIEDITADELMHEAEFEAHEHPEAYEFVDKHDGKPPHFEKKTIPADIPVEAVGLYLPIDEDPDEAMQKAEHLREEAHKRHELAVERHRMEQEMERKKQELAKKQRAFEEQQRLHKEQMAKLAKEKQEKEREEERRRQFEEYEKQRALAAKRRRQLEEQYQPQQPRVYVEELSDAVVVHAQMPRQWLPHLRVTRQGQDLVLTAAPFDWQQSAALPRYCDLERAYTTLNERQQELRIVVPFRVRRQIRTGMQTPRARPARRSRRRPMYTADPFSFFGW
ncbi:MAG: hypothetical protein MHM6MM_006114 [Cercozoa sp. M6MM]